VSYVPYVYFQKDDGAIDRMTKKDYDDKKAGDPASVPAHVVDVNKLYLNDVDAGFGYRTATFLASTEWKLLGRIAHVAPDLYARVMKLAALTAQPQLEAHAKREWRFTDNDYAKYTIMAAAVAQLFRDRCESGELLLDLDVAKHLAGQPIAPRTGCVVP
jgi:hypothetical protein